MKVNTIITAVLATGFLFPCNKTIAQHKPDLEKKQFTISGTIKGLGNNDLYYRYPDKTKAGAYRIDTIFVKNDSFSYTGKTESFEKRDFYTKKESTIKKVESGYIPSKANELAVFVFPGAKIKITGKVSDFIDAYPSGDAVNDKLAELNRQIYPLINTSAIKKAASVLTKNEEEKELFMEESKAIALKVKEIKLSFIKSNLNSLTAIETLYDLVMRGQINNDESIAIFNKLSQKNAQNGTYQMLKDRIKGIKSSEVGMQFPTIKTNSTLNGETFDLESLRGKYVLIDFWGTWCSPCVSEMPRLSDFYHKYKGKFEVIAINSGDTKEKLTQFLSHHEDYNWQHILSLKGDGPDDFVTKFNVTAFPTKFILNPEGKILKKYQGSGEDVFNFLEEQLK